MRAGMAVDTPLALTMGEPAGIAPEITLKAWAAKPAVAGPFFCIGDPAFLADQARALGLDVPVAVIGAPSEAAETFARALPVLPEALLAPVTPGTPTRANASAVINSIARAARFALDGEAAAVVTNPIHKKVLADHGFPHPGHTEFLGELSGGAQPVMMLACPGLRVVPVTVHLSLGDAIKRLNEDLIVMAGIITAEALAADFAISAPRLAVAALNPHAGEDGMMGREERKVIAPAVEKLKRKGIAAFGPAPADSLFHERARQTYDAVICMYHDQALIPLKTVDFDRGVDVTLGLPLVRTSPDHGTAFEIAGTGVAREHSLIAALILARDLALNRANSRALAGRPG